MCLNGRDFVSLLVWKLIFCTLSEEFSFLVRVISPDTKQGVERANQECSEKIKSLKFIGVQYLESKANSTELRTFSDSAILKRNILIFHVF